MSTERDFDRIAEAWLAEGPSELADRVLDAALDEVHLTHQRRRPLVPRRTPTLSIPLRLAAGIAIIAIVGYAGLTFLKGPGIGSTPPPTPTSMPTASPALTPAPAATLAPIDTTGWTTYTSSRYGFTLSLPPGWTSEPGDHDWTWQDDATNWLSTGADRFQAPGRAILVSAWTVPMEPGQIIESWSDVEAWARTYCERTANTGCTTIHDRVVPMCIEKRDCHPALLVPFKDDVQAFGTGGVLPEGMLVIAVWWGESAVATAPYGGSQRLLEGFLSTLNVWPPEFPEAQDAAATFVVTGQ
jgi:hypothetical protein